MGSLEKVTSEETLLKWADDVRKRLAEFLRMPSDERLALLSAR